jgi:hypothetical protein
MAKDILQIICEKIEQLPPESLDKADALLKKYLAIEKHRLGD